MRRYLLFLWIFLLPAMVFGQVTRHPGTKPKKMTVTKYVYDKGQEKSISRTGHLV